MRHLSLLLLVLVLSAGCARIDMWAKVTVLRGNYDIAVASKLLVLTPISGEGPFPTPTDRARFRTIGPPELIVVDGASYKRFTIGKNICSDFNVLSSGTVMLSEDRQELIVDGTLSKSYAGSTNPSGHYRKVEFQVPEIKVLTPTADIKSLYGKHVLATGRFSPREYRFRAQGHTFDDRGFMWCANESADYEVVGTLSPPYSPSSTVPIILIETYQIAGEDAPPTECRRN